MHMLTTRTKMSSRQWQNVLLIVNGKLQSFTVVCCEHCSPLRLSHDCNLPSGRRLTVAPWRPS